MEDAPLSDGATMEDSDIARYTEQAFKMYGCSVSDVAIEFENKLISLVQNRFGEHINIVRTAPDKYVVFSVQLEASLTFWGWIFQFEKQMRILSPEKLVEEYHGKIKEPAD